MTNKPDTKEACFRALKCLYISVDEIIAGDVNAKVKAHIYDQDKRIQELEDFVRTCKYYLQDGEPVYQFSVEKLNALSTEAGGEL